MSFVDIGFLMLLVLLVVCRRQAAELFFRYWDAIRPWAAPRTETQADLRRVEWWYLVVGLGMIAFHLLAMFGVIPLSTGTRVYPR